MIDCTFPKSIFGKSELKDDNTISVILSAIAGMRKKGLTDESIEIEILKEYNTVASLGDVRELME